MLTEVILRLFPLDYMFQARWSWAVVTEVSGINILKNWKTWLDCSQSNHKGHNKSNEPIKTGKYFHAGDTMYGNMCTSESRLVLVLLLISLENVASFLSQSLSVVIQNRSKRKSLSTIKCKPLYNNERAKPSIQFRVQAQFFLLVALDYCEIVLVKSLPAKTNSCHSWKKKRNIPVSN